MLQKAHTSNRLHESEGTLSDSLTGAVVLVSVLGGVYFLARVLEDTPVVFF